ncbi:hypothetical protein [Marinirhabdus gelatinilytica]|nr:hypothetical protein [Marinirhabdus gelatinilytica]
MSQTLVWIRETLVQVHKTVLLKNVPLTIAVLDDVTYNVGQITCLSGQH